MTDPLAPLLDLPDIAPAVAEARAAVDEALRHRALRRKGGIVAAEVSLRSAVASAALSGHRHSVDDVRSGTVLDPVVQGALRIAQEMPAMAETFAKAPRQVLARMHAVAASGVLPVDQLGRPVADPLVSARLDALCELVVAGAGEPILRAAVVHGELLALNAFEEGNGVVARAAARASLIGSGFDLRGLIAVDLGHLAREPEYVGSARAFATGTVDGVRSWLRHYTAALVVGAEEFTKIADEILAAV